MTLVERGESGSGFLRNRYFRVGYLLLALLYAGVVLFWGRHDLSRLPREYRLAVERLSGGQAQLQAWQEVAGGCLESAGGEEVPGYASCLKSSAGLVEVRAARIGAALAAEKQRALRKMVVFYGLVAVVMIMLPLALLYVFMVFLAQLVSSIRLKRD